MRYTIISLLLAAAVTQPVMAQIEDTEPPKLIGLSFTPNPIDVTTGPRTLTVDFTVTDNLSGASSVGASFRSPTGTQFASTIFGTNRISGTALNGVWRGTVQIPRYSEAGIWKIDVYLWDAVTNRVFLNNVALVALGLPTDLTVVSVPDVQPPRVTGISITPPAVDVSLASQNVTVDLTLTDDISGLLINPSSTGYALLTVFSPTFQQYFWVYNSQFTSNSGTNLNGTWRATFPIPRYSQPGTWGIQVYLVDSANNSVFFGPSQLQSLGLPATFNVTSTPADTLAPQLAGLSFTPTAIDTSAGPQTVNIQFQINDDRAGLVTIPFFGSVFVQGIFGEFISPSGAQFRSFSGSTLSAGTPLAGTVQGSIFFPQFSEAGTWKLSRLELTDAANNRAFLSTANLAAAGFPTELVVIRPSLQTDGTVGATGGTIIDQSFGARASVTFPPGAVSANTTVAIDVLTNPPAIPAPAGFSSGTFFTNINLSPAAAMPFPAPGLTLVLPLATFTNPGTAIQLFRLDPLTGSLVPAVNITGGNVMGTVAADGLTATFTGVARLSTVVGFIPLGKLGDVNGDAKVDCADVAIVRASFGRRTGQAGFDARADLNRDGVVNVIDLSIVSRQLPAGTVCQ